MKIVRKNPPANIDLVLQRVLDISPQDTWLALTDPTLLRKWFTPAPWKTVDCAIDLQPGGAFHVLMQSPQGEVIRHSGCFLEVHAPHRLVWSTALLAGYQPAMLTQGIPVFTAVITLEPTSGGGTRYTAKVLHRDGQEAQAHAKLGFHSGWGLALDQLVQTIKKLRGIPVLDIPIE